MADASLTQASGAAERGAALETAERIPGGTKRFTPGGDRGYDVAGFAAELSSPHEMKTHNLADGVPQLPECIGDRAKRAHKIGIEMGAALP